MIPKIIPYDPYECDIPYEYVPEYSIHLTGAKRREWGNDPQ